jgi:hypothetical protein
MVLYLAPENAPRPKPPHLRRRASNQRDRGSPSPGSQGQGRNLAPVWIPEAQLSRHPQHPPSRPGLRLESGPSSAEI